MAKLSDFSRVAFVAALLLCALSGVGFGQEALETQIQTLGSQLNGVKGDFRQRLDRIESLIDRRRNAQRDETGYSPRPYRHVDRYAPCCGRSERREPCCKYVGRYEPCAPALATEVPEAEPSTETPCRWGVGNCGWGARLLEN
jgi:hypothetical protein